MNLSGVPITTTGTTSDEAYSQSLASFILVSFAEKIVLAVAFVDNPVGSEM